MPELDLDRLKMTEQDRREDVVIGSNIARLRKEKGLSQTALAKAMRTNGHDWHQNTVSRIENGKQSLDWQEIPSLEEILGSVLKGTSLGESISELAGTITDVAIVQRLREAEAALSKATEAVADVRSLIQGRRRQRLSHGER